MFTKLKNKWKVNWFQFALIICTFALGGSICSFVSKKILQFFISEKNVVYYLLYFIVITLLWPLAVLLVSIPLGQFSFFNSYIKKIVSRIF